MTAPLKGKIETMRPCGLSFSADTLVATPTGEKAIDTLEVGDQVQAFDPATNKRSTQTVQHVFINHDTDLLDVTLTLDPGSQTTAHGLTGTSKQQEAAVASHGSHAPPSQNSTETIHTTQSHPWLTTKGWIKAGDLHLGDHILHLDGTAARVTKLQVIPGEQDMWDLTVSNVHTFAVGDGQWVVHNTNCTGNAAQSVADRLDAGLKASVKSFADKTTIAVANTVDESGTQQTIVALNNGSSNTHRTIIGGLLQPGETLAPRTTATTAAGTPAHAEDVLVSFLKNNNMFNQVNGFGVSRAPCLEYGCARLVGRKYHLAIGANNYSSGWEVGHTTDSNKELNGNDPNV